MRGKILGFDQNTGSGVISGDDGVRYGFHINSLQGGGTYVVPGKEVDFTAQGDQAVDIYPLASAAGEKNRLVAALLAFFLGALGVHKFYLGKTGAGVIMLLCVIPGVFLFGIPLIIVSIIAFIEFIIYLIKDDAKFHQDYVEGNKSWF